MLQQLKFFCVLKPLEIFLGLRTILWRPTLTNLNLYFGRNVKPETESLPFSVVTIQCDTELKLLGVTLDYKLIFSFQSII